MLLETLSSFLAFFIIFFVPLLPHTLGSRCVEGLTECEAVEQGVIALGIHRAHLLHDLLELILLVALHLALRVTLDRPDGIVWLAFAVRIPQVFVIDAITIVLPVVVVVVLGKAITFLLLFISPLLHHITELDDRRRAIASKIVVEALCCDALWK